MKCCVLLGILAGGVVGAAVAVMAYPHCRPEINRLLRHGKQCMDAKIDSMIV